MNKDCRLYLTLFFILLVLALPESRSIFAYTAGDSARGQVNIFSPENIRKFADYLYCRKDFLRAIEEYRKYLPENSDDTVKFKIALSLKMIGNYRKAEGIFISLSENSLLSDESKLELFRIRFISNDFSGYKRLYEGYEDFPQKYYSEITDLYYISFLFGNEALPGEQAFLNAFPAGSRNEMKTFYSRKKNPPYKSPAAAAVFSAIIPGAGKIYTKNYGDGITAFIVNGLMAYLAYDNFHSNHKFRGWTFAGLGLFFYAGNIYGSAASAQIYNAGIDYNFENDLKHYLYKNNYFMTDYESFCK